MKLNAKTVQEYYEKVPPHRQKAMTALREMIIENAPEVEETFQHELPFYNLADSPFIALASQKNHISLYLNDPSLIQEYTPKLGKVSAGKNCLRIRNFDLLDQAQLVELIRVAYKKRLDRHGLPG